MIQLGIRAALLAGMTNIGNHPRIIGLALVDGIAFRDCGGTWLLWTRRAYVLAWNAASSRPGSIGSALFSVRIYQMVAIGRLLDGGF